VDVTENDGNASMPEQVKRPNPRRKMMMMMMLLLLLMMMMMMNKSTV
jgi:predicted nucleic acid-binding Zn ribbon protein